MKTSQDKTFNLFVGLASAIEGMAINGECHEVYALNRAVSLEPYIRALVVSQGDRVVERVQRVAAACSEFLDGWAKLKPELQALGYGKEFPPTETPASEPDEAPASEPIEAPASGAGEAGEAGEVPPKVSCARFAP